jgi:hypothetical protein
MRKGADIMSDRDYFDDNHSKRYFPTDRAECERLERESIEARIRQAELEYEEFSKQYNEKRQETLKRYNEQRQNKESMTSPPKKRTKNLKQHRKKVYISTIVSVLLMVVSLIGYNVCRANCEEAYRHYYETITWTSKHIYSIGCGYHTCPYCEGSKKQAITPDADDITRYIDELNKFNRYSDINKNMDFWGGFGIAFSILAILLTGVSLIILIPSKVDKIKETQRLDE